MACVSDNDLVELLEGTLDATRRAVILDEIASCESCRAVLHDCLQVSSGGGASRAVPADVAGYRIDGVLGAGGGGIVVRARDPILDRDVALKLVHTRGDAGPETLALREARTLATVRHPAVISVYATGAIDHLGYVAMELVDGDSLATRLARGPLPWREAFAKLADVADGLAAIHAAGLVHRDIKPGNLLVDGDRLRIADFGLAVRDPDAAIAGTLPYLAPELLAGNAADTASDIYALFATVFEAITGDRPYREHDRRALRAAAEHGNPTWPSHVPVRVRRVVERGLAPDRNERFADARAAAGTLRGTIAHRSRVVWIAGAAVIAIAAIVIATRSRAGSCDTDVPVWPLDRVSAIAHARLTSYAGELAAAKAATCTDRSAAGDARRDCLDRTAQQVTALLASDVRAVDLDRAVFELPLPASCVSWRQRVATSPIDAAILAAANTALSARDPKRALAGLALLGQTSPLAADAELVRAKATLDLGDDAHAVEAFRRVSDAAAASGRDDLAVAAANGLALAIGVGERQPQAGEAYAMSARTTAQKLGDRRSAGIARRTIGWLAFQAGDAVRANTELAAASDELRAADAPLEVALAELDLASIARTKGDFAAARAHVERAFELRVAALGPNHPDTIDIDRARADIDATDGHADRARERMRSVVARLEAVYGADDLALAAPLASLGRALVYAGDYAAADATLSRALAIYRARRGELDGQTAQAYANVAQVRVVEGKFDDAIALERAAIASVRSALGDQHPDLAPLYHGLAVAYGSARRYADAADAQGHAIEILRAHPGHDDELAEALATRATIEVGLDRIADARRDAEDALATFDRMHGPDHVLSGMALMALAQAEYAGNDLAAARTTIERALAIHARVGAKPRETVEERVVLAEVLWRQNQHTEALAAARRALADLGDHDPALASRIRTWLRTPS